MADTTQEPKSAFLIQQEERMKLYAQQDRDIDDKRKHTLPGAAQEETTAQSNRSAQVTQIEQYNKTTGATEYRVVPFTPAPTQRFVRPEPLSLQEIRERAIAVGSAIDGAKDQFKADTDSLDSYYAEANALKAELAKLAEQVREKQSRLAEIESKGSPKDQFLSAILVGERETSEVAGLLLTTLCEQAAQKIFGINFSELSNDGKADTEKRFRKLLHRFVNGNYPALGRQATQKTTSGQPVPIPVERISGRAEQLLTDLDTIINTHLSE